MATRTSPRTGKRRNRQLSAKQRHIYLRRRIVVGVVLVVVLALVGFCVYSMGRGVAAIVAAADARHPDIVRDEVPGPEPTTGVRECTTSDVSLDLTVAEPTVGVGGSVEFTASIVYDGKVSCLIDGSDSSRILTITSGDDQVWRSDACPVDSRMLLMAKGDTDVQTITWNTNRSGSECVDDASLPKVSAGTYTAQLSLKGHPKIVSQKVPIVVQ